MKHLALFGFFYCFFLIAYYYVWGLNHFDVFQVDKYLHVHQERKPIRSQVLLPFAFISLIYCRNWSYLINYIKIHAIGVKSCLFHYYDNLFYCNLSMFDTDFLTSFFRSITITVEHELSVPFSLFWKCRSVLFTFLWGSCIS